MVLPTNILPQPVCDNSTFHDAQGFFFFSFFFFLHESSACELVLLLRSQKTLSFVSLHTTKKHAFKRVKCRHDGSELALGFLCAVPLRDYCLGFA